MEFSLTASESTFSPSPPGMMTLYAELKRQKAKGCESIINPWTCDHRRTPPRTPSCVRVKHLVSRVEGTQHAGLSGSTLAISPRSASHELLIKWELPVRPAVKMGWDDWKPFVVFLLWMIRDKGFAVTFNSATHTQGLSGTLRNLFCQNEFCGDRKSPSDLLISFAFRDADQLLNAARIP